MDPDPSGGQGAEVEGGAEPERACVPDPEECGCDDVEREDYRGALSVTEGGHACGASTTRRRACEVTTVGARLGRTVWCPCWTTMMWVGLSPGRLFLRLGCF